jgi:hypothetical protein
MRARPLHALATRGWGSGRVSCPMTEFQRFSRDLVALKRDPWVTIQKRGTISLNRAAYLLLGSPKAVDLLYSSEHQIVGLRPGDPRDRDAVAVRSPTGKDGGPFVVSGLAYIRFYEVLVDTSRRWPAYLENGVLCVDLREPGVPVSSNRAKRIESSP